MSLDTKTTWFGKHKYPTKVYLMCGWPLLLVLIGGAIGGALGALAFSMNLKIYNSALSNPVKVILNMMAGATAIAMSFVASFMLRKYFLNQ